MTKVICDQAGLHEQCEEWDCYHRKPHEYDKDECAPELCWDDEPVNCVKVEEDET